MSTAGKPWWQQVTAMVTLTAGGAVTGFSFVPGTAADLSSPTGVPVHLMALEHAARPSADDDAALRTAIVNVSHYYLRLAKGKSPAQMRAIWHAVADTAKTWLARGDRLWISTAGLGVTWVHVRIDSRPKYYTHAPYRVL